MIRKFFSKPKIRLAFYSLGPTTIHLLIHVTARARELWSKDSLPVPLSLLVPEPLERFLDAEPRRKAAQEALDSFDSECPSIEAFKKLPVAEMRSRVARRKELVADFLSVKAREEACEGAMAGPELEVLLDSLAIPLESKEDDLHDDRSYALYRGVVWSSERRLDPDHWVILADRVLEREEAELSSALALNVATTGTRDRITTEVRRAVWIRDGGKCVRCGSRTRLEFDHIVPVSRGGGNTERNIELLCEICNRAKSDSIT